MIKSEEMQNICRSMTVTDRVSTMLICFHGKKEGNLYGEILNCYIDGPVRFSNIGDLMLKLDEICDWVPSLPLIQGFLIKKCPKNMHAELREKTKYQ